MTGPADDLAAEDQATIATFAAALGAVEAIPTGAWDQYLGRLYLAIQARMRSPEYLHHRPPTRVLPPRSG